MSAESERKAAASLHQFIADTNTVIDHCHSLGLIVEIDVQMLQSATSPAMIHKLAARVLKPIHPEGS
jgi:hypothetical protein